ncbi:hypothetical protein J3E68DRAFT_413417 [Trichoderma sp. SZMC 28012]
MYFSMPCLFITFLLDLLLCSCSMTICPQPALQHVKWWREEIPGNSLDGMSGDHPATKIAVFSSATEHYPSRDYAHAPALLLCCENCWFVLC